MPVQRPKVAVSARRSILADGFLFGGVGTSAITIVAVQRPSAPYCQIESDQFTRCIQAEQIFAARTPVRSARFCQSHSANPRNTRSARSSRITSAAVMRPRRRERCPAASWFDPRRGGRFHQDRVKGAQTGFAVSGQTVTEAVAPSDRPGRSRPVWAFRYRHPEPRQRRCLPASLCGLGVVARFDRSGIDKRLIVGLALARRDSHRLPMRFRDKLRSPHVRNPDLNGRRPWARNRRRCSRTRSRVFAMRQC
jgi:hypothetical protein